MDKLLIRTRNDIFDSRPKEILALRKSIGWTRRGLGSVLGLYLNARDCYTIYRWEKGLSKPHQIYRAKLLQLVERFRSEYLEALRLVTNETNF